MKIIYWINTTDPKYGFYKDIESSLKKNNKVETINDREFNLEEFVKKCNQADMLLYHQGGIYMDNEMNYAISLERLKQILEIVKCKKVCWFAEKIWFLNNETMENIIPLNDFTFLNDDNWLRRHKYEKVYPLHMASGKRIEGEYNEKYKCDIAFYGHVFSFRKPFIDYLKSKYGRRFKCFNFVYGKDLADLIATAKLVFSPIQPNEEFYWDNRPYEVLNQGGTLIYPKLYGLQEEGFISGKHFLGYKSADDLIEITDEYLKNPAPNIAKEGQKFAEKITYDKRIKELFLICKK